MTLRANIAFIMRVGTRQKPDDITSECQLIIGPKTGSRSVA
jgi:hypothetical protein